MFKFTTPAIAHYLFPRLTWRIPNKEKKIFLTFDDGPVPGPTEEVLEILKDQNIKATFFCVGDNVSKHPHIFKKACSTASYQKGSIRPMSIKVPETSNQQYYKDIEDCDEIMQQSVHNTSRLFRPPYGKISLSQIKKLRNHKIIMWDVLARDYEAGLSAEYILKNIKKHTRSGSIIVFHDSVKTITQVKKTLPEYIKYCKQSGFQFTTL